MISVVVKKEGAWGIVADLSKTLTKRLFLARKICLTNWAFKASETAKQILVNQELAGSSWPALAASTVAKKKRAGYPTDTLIETGQYLDAIKGWTNPVSGKAFAGIPENKTYRSRGQKGLKGLRYMSFIARLQEYGNQSSNLPARPLWKPTSQRVMQWQLTSNRPETIFINLIVKRHGLKWQGTTYLLR